ncbi:MAG: transaldolase family protein [Gemmatimonadaceae bacterium]
MKIFLASASRDEVRWAATNGLVDGVITSPALLAAESEPGDTRALVLDLGAIAGVPVHVSVQAVDAGDVYRDGRELAKLGDTIVVQVPFVEDALAGMRHLCADGIRVAATFVFGTAQAVLAAKAGASSVVVPLAELEAVGLDAPRVIGELRAALDVAAPDCDIIALAPATAAAFAACAVAGADAVAVAPEALREFLVHPLTDRSLDRFLNEVSRSNPSWIAD